MLAPRPHDSCYANQHEADILYCSCLLSVSQRSFFNGNAARKGSLVCMAENGSFIVHVLEFDLDCLLAPCPHVCYCTAPHLIVDHWPFFNGLAASECASVSMAGVVSPFVNGLGPGILMFACSTTACLLLCCTTFS